MRVIVSGGGTAGHIYPALAVAEELRERGVEVLFVGASGKMEMERVPKAGFEIVGLPIAGIRRSLSPSAICHNLKVPFKLMKSSARAKRILKEFRPDAVAGFGGYASAPIVKAAQKLNIPTLLQEQNSYAGLTNKILAKKAKAICTAYEGMERFFGEGKITITGNPLRGNVNTLPSKAQGAEVFGFSENSPIIVVTGGSLGTRTMNEMVFSFLKNAKPKGSVQVVWQCGKFYHEEFKGRVQGLEVDCNIKYLLVPFIENMGAAYAAADLVVCRSGASTVSELQLLGVPPLFIPSPNVAEDHQTANAKAVVKCGGAEMVRDADAVEKAMDKALGLLENKQRLEEMSRNIKTMAKPRATKDVADMIFEISGWELPPQKEEKESDEVSENRIENIYFVGIGGIGMSALARFFLHKGYRVAGYDRVRTALCAKLEAEGVEIHYEDSIEEIPRLFRDKATTKVIYTPAIPKTHSELNWLRDEGFEVIKRSKALGLLCSGMYTMAVAGTHGKSSTSTMVAWLNHTSSTDGGGSAFLGAISKNFASNIVMGDGDRIAVEADEFDRSFHALTPSVALITSADADHLDIYGTAEAFKEAFEIFAAKCSDAVVVKKGVELVLPSALKNYTYALEDSQADYFAKNITLTESGCYTFDIVTPSGVIEGCELGVPGLVNVENAIGAVALVDQKGFDRDRLREGLRTYKGIERRLDLWVNSPKGVYMDDYAHHPTELRVMLLSLRNMFPERHITIAFQPHLYSRTRDFAEGFAESLSLADRVVLIPIYPAREEPIEGVSSEMILEKVSGEKYIVAKSELVGKIASLETDIVVSAGAGDIDTLRGEIAKVIEEKVRA
ncbi:MAG: undecaprenyldiphospho-muramoylpentapeptide beta-N-acetylglucosaminyltransferase [Rikenellaceae bacterium]